MGMCLSVLFKGIISCLKYIDENKHPSCQWFSLYVYVSILSLSLKESGYERERRWWGTKKNLILPFIFLWKSPFASNMDVFFFRSFPSPQSSKTPNEGIFCDVEEYRSWAWKRATSLKLGNFRDYWLTVPRLVLLVCLQALLDDTRLLLIQNSLRISSQIKTLELVVWKQKVMPPTAERLASGRLEASKCCATKKLVDHKRRKIFVNFRDYFICKDLLYLWMSLRFNWSHLIL